MKTNSGKLESMMEMEQPSLKESTKEYETATLLQPYDAETEAMMKQFYANLSEKERRQYAGMEALKLGRGGQKYVACLFGCSRNTVKKGAEEVSGLSRRAVDQRIRQPGGGRKKYSETWVNIDEQFLTIVREHTAGDPMDDRIIWTDLSEKEIQQQLGKTYDVWVSQPIVKKLLKKHGYRKRKAQKKTV